MITIGVITFHRSYNYGGVLQAYATQEIIASHSHDVFLIDFCPARDAHDRPSPRWNRNAFTRLVWSMAKRADLKRLEEVFGSFIDARLSLSPSRHATFDDLKENPPAADIYCTGSDQTWNKNITGEYEDVYCLSFLPKGARAISFSSSFGRPALDAADRKRMKELLSRYESISVREQSGLGILKTLGIQHGVWLIDPTLALPRQRWLDLITARKIGRKYILTYQLNKNGQFDGYVRELARRKGFELARVSFAYHHILRAGRQIYCPSVEDWLSLLCHAECIVTDAFHGVVFSINFNKPFVTILPPLGATRIQSILELTGLSGRVLTDYKDFSIADTPIDYSRVNATLEVERGKVDDFLDQALNGEHSAS